MALTAATLREVYRLLHFAGAAPRIASFSCPDLLLSDAELHDFLPATTEVLWRPDSDAILRWHRRLDLHRVPDTAWMFSQAGGRLSCFDLHPGRGGELPVDLESPLPVEHCGQYDLVLDTMSHQCFKIAQAWTNALHACRPGGIILHILPVTHPNQGFWSVSPSALEDFYQFAGAVPVRRRLLTSDGTEALSWTISCRSSWPHGTLAVYGVRCPDQLPLHLRPRMWKFRRCPDCKLPRRHKEDAACPTATNAARADIASDSTMTASAGAATICTGSSTFSARTAGLRSVSASCAGR